MQFIYIPTLNLIFAAVIFFATVALLYLFVRRSASFWGVARAYAVFAVGNFILSFLFSLSISSSVTLFVPSGILKIVYIVVAIGLTFLVFYGVMRWLLSVSWKRSLAMFLIVFMLFVPLANHMLTVGLELSSIMEVQPLAKEAQSIGSFFSPGVLGGYEPYLVISNKVSTAVSNWQIGQIARVIYTF